MYYSVHSAGRWVRFFPRVFALLVWLGVCCQAVASLKDDVGYTQLQDELGAALPLGSASVFQIEADSPQDSNQWIANQADSQFSGKVIDDLSVNVAAASGTSGHATGVGRRFYGNTSSMSPGISDIGAYGVDGWLLDQTVPNGSYNPVTLSLTGVPAATDRRIANHSWVGTGLNDPSTGTYSPELTASWLRHNDWFADIDELIQLYGTSNGGSGQVLFATCFNGIVAGITQGTSANQVVAVEGNYVAGRAAIHIVTPTSTSSSSTPTVASAAALLIDAASSNPSWSESSTSNRNGTTIYNAERTETIKAALMAGASRWTINSSGQGDIQEYREAVANQTGNGLDWRYGAGQLNVYNSYHILAAGEKSSLEDGGSPGKGYRGFDHDPAFGGLLGSNTTATYDLGVISEPMDLGISLVWHLRNFTSAGAATFNESSELYDMDLELVDVSNGNTVVAQSASTIDNTENIWYSLEPGTHYQIRVTRGSGQGNFNWDYSIAWFAAPGSGITTVPVPLWVYLVLPGVFVITARVAQRRSVQQ